MVLALVGVGVGMVNGEMPLVIDGDGAGAGPWKPPDGYKGIATVLRTELNAE